MRSTDLTCDITLLHGLRLGMCSGKVLDANSLHSCSDLWAKRVNGCGNIQSYVIFSYEQMITLSASWVIPARICALICPFLIHTYNCKIKSPSV